MAENGKFWDANAGAGTTNNLNETAVNGQPTTKLAADDIIEIDLLALCRFYLQHWLVLVLALVIGVGLGIGYQRFFVGTTYKADTSIFIADVNNVSASFDVYGLAISKELSVDYENILMSRTTLKQAGEAVGLDLTYTELSSLISLSRDEDSHIIKITVTTDSAKTSRALADDMRRVGSKRIQDITAASEPTVVDYATEDSIIVEKVGWRRYPAMGGFIGLCIPALLLLLQFLMDNTLKGEDDVRDKLKKPVLAAIPYYKGCDNLIDLS